MVSHLWCQGVAAHISLKLMLLLSVGERAGESWEGGSILVLSPFPVPGFTGLFLPPVGRPCFFLISGMAVLRCAGGGRNPEGN